MKKSIISLIIVFCVFAGVVITFSLFGAKQQTSPAGTWWWNNKLDYDQYLNFASENNINEIYFYSNKFDETTHNFISKANAKNIEVYWLAGKYEWLSNNSDLIEKIDNYTKYQNDHQNAQFSGIHLDIEPHQNPNFNENRYQLIYNLIDLASTLKNTYPEIKFDYDLPFWLHDEITYNNKTKPAYEFMIDIANRIFVMSYRDTAEAILKIAKEEIAYAKEQNKQLVLCVETYSTEGDNVSFFEEGKQIMQKEISKLKESIPQNFGIAIHHIKSWYDLKD